VSLPPSEPIRVFDPKDAPERALVICAHPDDVDFGCAGTVAALTAAGVSVSYCLVTSGEAGGSDRGQSREEMAAIRRDEQRAAAARVGVSDLTFLGYPDGRLAATFELRRDLSRVIRSKRPSLAIVPSPTRRFDAIYASHPDHLAAGEAAMAAVYPDARNPFAHPELLEEGLEPHTVGQLWIMAAPDGNLAVDVTDTFERKLAALACHRSQGTDTEAVRERLLEWGTAVARAAGLAAGRLAETFWAMDTG
jgi:LmbE family N-acetylglucosaminyl deacetylase